MTHRHKHKHNAAAVGGPILTRTFLACLAVFALSIVVLAWRFVVGLGPTTGMNDGFPWGIWIAFDVVTGTALACGGYSVAILCYALNEGSTTRSSGRRPDERVGIFAGRRFRHRRPGAVLERLEDPADLELEPELRPPRSRDLHHDLRGRSLDRAVPGVCRGLGEAGEVPSALPGGPPRPRMAQPVPGRDPRPRILLPTMHQSSLGSLMLIMTSKLHKLWHTPLLPFLFLATAVLMATRRSSSSPRWQTRCSTGRGRRGSWRLCPGSWWASCSSSSARGSPIWPCGPAGPRGPAGLLQLDVPPGDGALPRAAILLLSRKRRYNPGSSCSPRSS